MRAGAEVRGRDEGRGAEARRGRNAELDQDGGPGRRTGAGNCRSAWIDVPRPDGRPAAGSSMTRRRAGPGATASVRPSGRQVVEDLADRAFRTPSRRGIQVVQSLGAGGPDVHTGPPQTFRHPPRPDQRKRADRVRRTPAHPRGRCRPATVAGDIPPRVHPIAGPHRPSGEATPHPTHPVHQPSHEATPTPPTPPTRRHTRRSQPTPVRPPAVAPPRAGPVPPTRCTPAAASLRRPARDE